MERTPTGPVVVVAAREDDAGASVHLEGFFRPAWMAGLCAGLGDRGVSIERVDAVCADGWWKSDLVIVPPRGLDAHSIPYAALVENTPAVSAGALHAQRYRLTESPEHGGTLKLELHAEDSIGFLGRVLSVLAMLSLFPVGMRIETRDGRAHDRFWLSGVGRALPTPQSRKLLERMLAGAERDETKGHSFAPERFVSPDWDAPLDGLATVRATPADATIAGMFPEAIVQEARRRQLRLPAARERYAPFEFYPLAEHIEVLLQAAKLFFPDKSLRAALRTIGRAAPEALLSSTLGRVALAGQDVHGALSALARTCSVNMRPTMSAETIEKTERSVVVRLRGTSFFLDCHHVGVLEGTMLYAGVRGSVSICLDHPDHADFLCRW